VSVALGARSRSSAQRVSFVALPSEHFLLCGSTNATLEVYGREEIVLTLLPLHCGAQPLPRVSVLWEKRGGAGSVRVFDSLGAAESNTGTAGNGNARSVFVCPVEIDAAQSSGVVSGLTVVSV
jgi:hypothetical protein